MYQPQHKSSKNAIIEENNKLKDIDLVGTENKLKILSFLKTIPASYLSEIAWETQVSDYELKQIMTVLNRDELIETINVSTYDPRLIRRVQDQSAIGQSGLANFSKKRWFGITNKGLEYLEINTW